MYRQPDDTIRGNTSGPKELNKALSKIQEMIIELQNPVPDIIFGGDFNLPHSSWPDCQAKAGCPAPEKDMIQLLCDFSMDLNLS